MNDESRLVEFLSIFRAIIDSISGLEIGDLPGHSMAANELSTVLVELEYSRIVYHKKWTAASYNFSGSKTDGDRFADVEVPELYQLRHLMHGGYKKIRRP